MKFPPEFAGTLIAYLIFLAPPFWMLFGRIGKSRLWVALLLIPGIGGVILLWVVAFANWSTEKHGNSYQKALH